MLGPRFDPGQGTRSHILAKDPAQPNKLIKDDEQGLAWDEEEEKSTPSESGEEEIREQLWVSIGLGKVQKDKEDYSWHTQFAEIEVCF